MGQSADQTDYTLTRLRMVGKGEDSSGYKIAFFPPSTLEGAEGFLVGSRAGGLDEVCGRAFRTQPRWNPGAGSVPPTAAIR